jgi:hypothetical protein
VARLSQEEEKREVEKIGFYRIFMI